MLIGKLEVGTAATIHVTDGLKAVQLNSKVIAVTDSDKKLCEALVKKQGYKSYICLKAITANNRVVSFTSENITCTITALSGKKPYSWKGVTIQNVILSEHVIVHIVMSNDDVKTFNRRREFRLFLGVDGECVFGNDRHAKNVLIKDVSCTGLGMLVPKDGTDDIIVGMPVKMQFCDCASGDSLQKYSLEGKIVRFLSTGSTKKLVGCKLIGRNPELEKLIYAKQRQNMAASGNLQVKHGLMRDVAKELKALNEQDKSE